MGFPVTVGLDPGQEKVVSTTKQRPLGTRGVTPDGRVFYYAQAGATALVTGNALQTAVNTVASTHAASLDVVAANTTGVSTITVVFVTPEAANLYADGYLTVDTSPGQALYQVKSHPALTSAAGGIQVTLADNDVLREAMTSGTTKVGVRRNPYTSVVAVPTTMTGVCVGIAPISVAAGSYFWAQTYGPALAGHIEDVPVAGEELIVPGASAGGIAVATTVPGDHDNQTIGVVVTGAGGADDYSYVFLTIRA